jgi:hypothetical protein
MTVVKEQLGQPGPGTPWPLEVIIRLAGPGGRPVLGKVISTGETIVSERRLRSGDGINNSGYWELDLEPNSDIKPDGTTWFLERRAASCTVYESFITVPITGGPFDAFYLEDDPLGTITPSALSAHASDQTLHGGGIQVDFKYIQTATIVTGSGGGLTLAPLTATQITVPDLARPIMLHGRLPLVQPSGGPNAASWGIFNVALGYGAFGSLDSINAISLSATTNQTYNLWAELPAHSPGNYNLAGTGSSGNLTSQVACNALQRAFLRAVTL